MELRLKHNKIIPLTTAVLIISSIALMVLPYQKVAFGTFTSEAFACLRSEEVNDVSNVKFRSWEESTATWNSLVTLPDGGNGGIQICRIIESPIEDRLVVVTLSDTTIDLDLYTCTTSCDTASNWTLEESNFATPNCCYDSGRNFDIMFEKTTGDVLIVYESSSLEVNDFYYRVWDTATTSFEGAAVGVNYIGGATGDAESVRYMELAQDNSSGSDEIALTLLDGTNADVYAFIWDGSTFTNQQTCSSAVGTLSDDFMGTGISYERGSDDTLVSCANNTNDINCFEWDGSAWNDRGCGDPNATAGNDVTHVHMRSNPVSTSTEIMFCNIDDLNDFNCAEWSGTALGSWTKLDANLLNAGVAGDVKSGDFSYDPSGGTGVGIYADAASSIKTRDFTGTTFNTEVSTTVVNSEFWFEGAVNSVSGDTTDSLWISSDNEAGQNVDIGSTRWNGSTLSLVSNTQPTSDSSINVKRQVMDLVWQEGVAADTNLQNPSGWMFFICISNDFHF